MFSSLFSFSTPVHCEESAPAVEASEPASEVEETESPAEEEEVEEEEPEDVCSFLFTPGGLERYEEE